MDESKQKMFDLSQKHSLIISSFALQVSSSKANSQVVPSHLSSMSVAKAELQNSILDGTTIVMATLLFPSVIIIFKIFQTLSRTQEELFFTFPFAAQLTMFFFCVPFPLMNFCKKSHLRKKVMSRVSGAWTNFIDCKT